MATPFELLGITPAFMIDKAQLQAAYLRRAAQLHPDISHLPEEDAASATAELNRARAVLADPESRADALLRVLGGSAKETDKSLPDGFLMEIMEIREAVDIALAGGDAAQRAHWQAWTQNQRQHYIDKVAEQFRALSTPPAPLALRDIRKTLNAWRYIERLLEQLDPAYDPNQADFTG